MLKKGKVPTSEDISKEQQTDTDNHLALLVSSGNLMMIFPGSLQYNTN